LLPHVNLVPRGRRATRVSRVRMASPIHRDHGCPMCSTLTSSHRIPSSRTLWSLLSPSVGS
jgi:hypothetical protein